VQVTDDLIIGIIKNSLFQMLPRNTCLSMKKSNSNKDNLYQSDGFFNTLPRQTECGGLTAITGQTGSGWWEEPVRPVEIL
jgi:hypothetical protein